MNLHPGHIYTSDDSQSKRAAIMSNIRMASIFINWTASPVLATVDVMDTEGIPDRGCAIRTPIRYES